MAKTKFADLDKLRKPARVTLTLQLDGTAQTRENDLRRAIANARQAEAVAGSDLSQGPPDSVVDMENELDEVRAAAADTMASFTFEACSFAALEALQYKYPPDDKQKAEGLQWDVERFAPALMALTNLEPGLTDDDATELWTTWEAGLVNTLYRAAWDVCNANPVVRPLSKVASAKTTPTGPNLSTAESAASPAAGS